MPRLATTIHEYPTEGLPVPWATWIPDRTPQFKVHNDLGHAKNAVGAEISGRRRLTPNGAAEPKIRGGVVYEMVDGKWTVRAVVPPGSYKSDHIMFANSRQWNKQPGITSVITEHPYEV